MRKPTVELNLVPSRNQDQFDFAIYKPATIAIEEFTKKLIKILLNNYYYKNMNFMINVVAAIIKKIITI